VRRIGTTSGQLPESQILRPYSGVADAAPADAAVTPTIAIACEPDRPQLTPADGARCRYAAEVTVRRTLLLPMRAPGLLWRHEDKEDHMT
jgi:hypothetical protein